MRSSFRALASVAALVVPVVAFSQANTDLTRAQVKSELVQLEHAGYAPNSDLDVNYPQHAQASLAQAGRSTPGASSIGGVAPAYSSAGGGRDGSLNKRSVYFGL
jgi:hypothetical protein